jgi:DNA-binding response OmpR family regulator
MKKAILIIDDEESIRSILAEYLSEQGYRVASVASPSEARRAVKMEPPDLIITDLQLEDSDGLDLVAQLKAGLQAIPVILLTGVLFDARVAENLESRNIACYLSKTAPLARVLAEVRRLIGPV